MPHFVLTSIRKESDHLKEYDRVKGFLLFLPSIAVIAASIFAVQLKAPALALDQEAIKIISESPENTPAGQASAQNPVNSKKPKVDIGAAASAKGLAAGKEAGKAAAGASKTLSHNSALDNATFKDGTYTGSAQGFNGPVTVKVVIKDGKIKSVGIVSNSDTPSYFSRARKLTSSIVKKQSTKVDSVSGATYSSNGIIKATEKALMKAAGKSEKSSGKNKKSTAKIKVSKKKYNNGTYTGKAKGYRGDVTVEVTIKKHKIAKVKVVSNSDTPSYFSRAKKLISKIVKSNSPNVDAVTGATLSSNGIKNAVKEALKKASGKNTEPEKEEPVPETPEEVVLDTKYENGVYEGSAVGYTSGSGLVCMTYATVTVENNKIAKIDLESQDPTLGGDEWYWNQAYPKVPDAIVRTNNPDVDTVSGATMSSNGIINAVKDALKGHELKEEQSEGTSDDTMSLTAEAPRESEPEESSEAVPAPEDEIESEQDEQEPEAPASTPEAEVKSDADVIKPEEPEEEPDKAAPPEKKPVVKEKVSEEEPKGNEKDSPEDEEEQ